MRLTHPQKRRGIPAAYYRPTSLNSSSSDMFLRPFYLVPAVIGAVAAVPTAKRASPSIQLDGGTFVGTSDGTVDKFLGIPFAKPPCVVFA